MKSRISKAKPKEKPCQHKERTECFPNIQKKSITFIWLFYPTLKEIILDNYFYVSLTYKFNIMSKKIYGSIFLKTYSKHHMTCWNIYSVPLSLRTIERCSCSPFQCAPSGGPSKSHEHEPKLYIWKVTRAPFYPDDWLDGVLNTLFNDKTTYLINDYNKLQDRKPAHQHQFCLCIPFSRGNQNQNACD